MSTDKLMKQIQARAKEQASSKIPRFSVLFEGCKEYGRFTKAYNDMLEQVGVTSAELGKAVGVVQQASLIYEQILLENEMMEALSDASDILQDTEN